MSGWEIRKHLSAMLSLGWGLAGFLGLPDQHVPTVVRKSESEEEEEGGTETHVNAQRIVVCCSSLVNKQFWSVNTSDLSSQWVRGGNSAMLGEGREGVVLCYILGVHLTFFLTIWFAGSMCE